MVATRKLLILSALLGLGVSGCSLEPPVEVGEECGKDTGQLSFILMKVSDGRCSKAGCSDCSEADEAKCESYRDKGVFDSLHCPTSDYVCVKDDALGQEACVERCAAYQTLCRMKCVDTMNESENCGGCGIICDQNEEKCDNGKCVPLVIQCAYTMCGEACVDLATHHMASCDSCLEGWCNTNEDFTKSLFSIYLE